MKLHILSDLHREFLAGRQLGYAYQRDPAYQITQTDADVIVLAGDIDVGTAGVEWAIVEAERLQKPIVYVMGNHELYGHSTELSVELRALAQGTGVHFLETDLLILNGVRFLGCSLWTDFNLFRESMQAEAMAAAARSMNDYRVITHGGRRLTPEDTLWLHQQSCVWLEAQLAEPFAGPTVVVTHTGPSPRSAHPQYGINLLSGAFLTNLEHLMGAERVALWIHGHTHACADYEIRGTRVISNQRGYPGIEEVHGFNPMMMVEV